MTKKSSGPAFVRCQIPMTECPSCCGAGLIQGVFHQLECIGCGLCVTNCPWQMPRLRLDTRKSTKCINCGACVAGCPTSALKMIQWEDVATAMSAGA